MIETQIEISENLTGKEKAAALITVKNIKFFCRTPKGSLAQMRDYGIDFTVFDEPVNVIKRKLTVDIVSGIRKFFDITVSEISVTADKEGKIKVFIKI